MDTLYVIVPIYNVEKYLKECLDSIQNQFYKNFKVVMINDGSTDSSAQIAKEYATKDSRFILINQANAGVGMARNKGLEFVRADSDEQDYVGYVDPDDIIPKDYYLKLIDAMKAHNLSMAKAYDLHKFYDEAYDQSMFEATSSGGGGLK